MIKPIIILAASAFMSVSLQAKEIQSTVILDCKLESFATLPTGITGYRVAEVKQVSRELQQGPGSLSKTHKISTSYLLIVLGVGGKKLGSYKFIPAGSGDEGYNDYDVKASRAEQIRIGVSLASIHENFDSVNLSNPEGLGFADCRR